MPIHADHLGEATLLRTFGRKLPSMTILHILQPRRAEARSAFVSQVLFAHSLKLRGIKAASHSARCCDNEFDWSLTHERLR